MQYNSDSDNQDIVSLIGDKTGLNTTVEIAQITRAVNKANKQIWSWIFMSFGGWQYEDQNQTGLPVATASIVANQQKYTLPSSALAVASVEWLNGTTWEKLTPLSIEQINQYQSEKEFEDTPGTPRFYSLISNVLKLYPASDTAVSNGLRIQIERGSVSFATTDTNVSPGFASEFHEALATGAAVELSRNNVLPNYVGHLEDWRNYEKSIKDYYSARYQEMHPENLRGYKSYASEMI